MIERHESVVEKKIREAQERGAFDNLPGAGKSLPGMDEPDDELWWVRRFIEREGLSSEVLLPPSLQLRKEIDRLPETVRALRTEQQVRDAVREVNLRVVEHLRAPSGPRVRVRPIDADTAVERWRAERGVSSAPPPATPGPDTPRSPWWRRSGHRRD